MEYKIYILRTIEDESQFLSATDAARILNIERSKISVCNGKRNHVGGYKFRYKA